MPYLLWMLLLTPFVLLRISRINGNNIKGTWVEKALIKDLLHDYEKRARPVVDGVSKEVQLGDAKVQQITVDFGLSLIQILKLNENEQILTVSTKSLYRWPDYHLTWNPEDYDNITYITIPTSKIWIPDIALYNYADERLEERRDCAARVDHNGTVEWHPMAIYKSTCAVKIKYFPYDKQNCNLRFGPWTFDNSRVNISYYYSHKNWDLKDYVASPEWRLCEHSVVLLVRQYACCPEAYSDMIFQITIERQPAYYNYLLILPCFLLSSLTLVLFWLPPETPGKMVLGMNIFLAFFLLLLLLEDSIPSASSSFPLIGNYYCINMTLVTVSTFLCLIVVNLHFRGDRRTEVPPWLKKLAIHHGARLLFVNVAQPRVAKSKSPAKKTAKANHVDATGKDNENMQSYWSQFCYYPGAGMHFADAPYPHSHIPRIPQPAMGAQRYPFPSDYPAIQRMDPLNVFQRHPAVDACAPVYPMTDVNVSRLQYPNFTDVYNRYPEWMAKSSREDPNQACSFCPACAGLAAAAAAAANTDADASDDMVRCRREPVVSPALPPNFVQDPTEHLAAVWAAAMSGSTPHVLSPSENDTRRVPFAPEDDGDQKEEDEEEEEEEIDDHLNTISSARDRSVGPDLECFLLECIRPHSSSKKAVAAGKQRWTSPLSSRPDQQNLPASPFYEFTSPHCDEDPHDPSVREWPLEKRTLPQTVGNAPDDVESEESGPTGLWRSQYSGRSSHGEAVKRGSASRNPELLRRVQNVKRDVSDVVRGLRFMQRLNDNKQKVNRVIGEWRDLGMVLDRMFFIIYLCALGISIIMYFPRSGDDLD